MTNNRHRQMSMSGASIISEETGAIGAIGAIGGFRSDRRDSEGFGADVKLSTTEISFFSHASLYSSSTLNIVRKIRLCKLTSSETHRKSFLISN